MKTKSIISIILISFFINNTILSEDKIKADLSIIQSPLIKKTDLSPSTLAYLTSRLGKKLNFNDILVRVKIAKCTCHNFESISCPMFPEYLPLSLFINEKNNSEISFKKENDKISLPLYLNEIDKTILATLYLKQKNQDVTKNFDQVLKKLYEDFKKANPNFDRINTLAVAKHLVDSIKK